MKYTPKRVEIVEDDEDDFKLTLSLLRELYGDACHVGWVRSSSKALELIPQQAADVYLIDYQIDERTGADLLKEFQKLNLTKPMIFMTGYCDREVDLDLMEKGADAFLSKADFTASFLERSIRYAMKRAENRSRLIEVERMKAEANAVKETAEMKNRVLSKINHELRTPLTAILGYTTMALEQAKTAEEKDKHLEVIDRNGKYLLQIINDFLDLSKIDSNCTQIANERFDVMPVIDLVIDLMRPLVANKGLKLFVERPHTPVVIESDPFRLRQILTNLIGNAAKFTNVGSITLGFARTGPWLEISVTDTGRGIEENERARIFQPFYQVQSRDGKAYGTGLGLQLAQQLFYCSRRSFDSC